jgi:CRISPR-associated protein (TIGR02710 family)
VLAVKKALVQSVGTGTRQDSDITKPLLWHFRRSGAGFVAWVVSEESRVNAERMARELNLSSEQFEIRPVTGIEDVEHVYRECRTLLRNLESRGFAPDLIEVDYTSGTKAMTAGLVLAAVAARCATLSYIAGERRSGVVVDGTERLVPIEPRRIWADERLQLAADYCIALRFDAAVALLEDLNDAWLGEYERRVRSGLLAVAQGYGAWDRFDYDHAIGELRKVLEITDVLELAAFRPEQEVPRWLVRLKSEHGITADRLADLFNNAQRRLDEGRYDDALARLYRVAEMLAQWVLRRQYDIDPADVALDRVPAPLREALAQFRNRDGRVQIGLDWDYRLLEAFGHPLGANFDRGEFHGMGVLLKRRNMSLLAHGLTPIARTDVEALKTKLESFVVLEAADLAARRAVLEFPWRRRNG